MRAQTPVEPAIGVNDVFVALEPGKKTASCDGPKSAGPNRSPLARFQFTTKWFLRFETRRPGDAVQFERKERTLWCGSGAELLLGGSHPQLGEFADSRIMRVEDEIGNDTVCYTMQ